MMFRPAKLLVTGLVTAAVFVLLLRIADFSQLDISKISPALAIVPLGLMIIMIGLRGELLRHIAPANRASSCEWQSLVGRHQLLFMLAPCGLGDAGFFMLAQRYAKLNATEAT